MRGECHMKQELQNWIETENMWLSSVRRFIVDWLK